VRGQQRRVVLDDRDGVEVRECPQCGERMVERQCKIICANCGMMRDCSDP